MINLLQNTRAVTDLAIPRTAETIEAAKNKQAKNAAGNFLSTPVLYARWAHMHRFLSVRLSVSGPKFTRSKFISQELFDLGSPDLVCT